MVRARGHRRPRRAILMHPPSGGRRGTSPTSPTRWWMPQVPAALPRRPDRADGSRGRRVPLPEVRRRAHRGAQFNLMFETPWARSRTTRAIITCGPRRRRGSSSTSRTCCSPRGGSSPFGIAQIGKSFRNEITPGNFIFRTREFEQMEMEFFCRPAGRGVAPALDGRSHELVPRISGSGRTTCGSASTARRALALLGRDERHRVPLPDGLVGARGNRQPDRLRPPPARRVLG